MQEKMKKHQKIMSYILLSYHNIKLTLPFAIDIHKTYRNSVFACQIVHHVHMSAKYVIWGWFNLSNRNLLVNSLKICHELGQSYFCSFREKDKQEQRSTKNHSLKTLLIKIVNLVKKIEKKGKKNNEANDHSQIDDFPGEHRSVFSRKIPRSSNSGKYCKNRQREDAPCQAT